MLKHIQKKINNPNKGVSFNHADWAAVGVLQHILGSGRALYSRGISGGTSSRLNRNLVEKNSQWIKSVQTFNLNYSDKGLFGVYGMADRGRTDEFINLIRSELSGVSKSVTDEEITRGQRSLQSSFLFEHQKQPKLVEFVARQAQHSQQILTPSEFIRNAVSKVTRSDVSRVANEILSANPTLVVVGDVDGTPILQDLS